jgi:DNA-binding response OmpR family regulator
VLLVGSVRELALYRAEVLRKAGFVVSTPEDVDDALSIIGRQNFDVIVLSYTLTNESVERLADAAREHCGDCPIISITRTPIYDRLIDPDAVVIGEEGPAALLAALNRVLQTK